MTKKENVFDKLKAESKGKRGKGLDTPPNPSMAGNNTKLPENAPAVLAKAPKREYRVSNYISNEAGERLEQLMLDVKKKMGRKVKIAEVLEYALEALDESIKTEKR